MANKVKIEVTIDEIDTIISYHYKWYKMIDNRPKDQQDSMTKAGRPLRETGQKHLRRYRELRGIKENTWPK